MRTLILILVLVALMAVGVLMANFFVMPSQPRAEQQSISQSTAPQNTEFEAPEDISYGFVVGIAASEQLKLAIYLAEGQAQNYCYMLQSDAFLGTAVDLKAEQPLQATTAALQEKGLPTQGWAAVSQETLGAFFAEIGSLEAVSESDFSLGERSIKKGSTILTADECLAAVLSEDNTPEALQFKLSVVRAAVQKAQQLSGTQKIVLLAKLSGGFKYQADAKQLGTFFKNAQGRTTAVDTL